MTTRASKAARNAAKTGESVASIKQTTGNTAITANGNDVKKVIDPKTYVNRKRPRERSPGSEFKCLDCGKIFDSSDSKAEHLHPKLKICSLLLSNVTVEKKSSGKDIECSTCPETFTDLHDLRKHLKSHPRKERLTCKLCAGKTFQDAYNISVHMLEHTGIKPQSCGICGTILIYPEDMEKHAKEHED